MTWTWKWPTLNMKFGQPWCKGYTKYWNQKFPPIKFIKQNLPIASVQEMQWKNLWCEYFQNRILGNTFKSEYFTKEAWNRPNWRAQWLEQLWHLQHQGRQNVFESGGAKVVKIFLPLQGSSSEPWQGSRGWSPRKLLGLYHLRGLKMA